MNRLVKSLIERTLISSGAARFTLARQPGDAALVLAYHNVVPADVQPCGDRSLHLSRDDFARQLDVLQEMHEVVSLASLMESEHQTGRRRVAITFDDAYAGALSVGLEEMARRGLPGTVFVAPQLLGTIPWWDAVARCSSTGLTEEARQHALVQLAGQHTRVFEWAALSSSVEGHTSPSERIATLDELTAAATYPQLAVAPHSWSHPNLSALSTEDVVRELTLPLEWLKARFASTLPLLSYPYGLHSATVIAAAEHAGYEGAFRVDGGWFARSSLSSKRYAVPRYNVAAGLSIDGFRLRLSAIGAGS